MKIIFYLPFRTTYGQNLRIVGGTPELGQWDPARGAPMRYSQDGFWRAEIHISEDEEPFGYRYVLDNRNAGIMQSEGGPERRLEPRDYRGCATLERRDYWRPPADPETILATAPFRQAVFPRQRNNRDCGRREAQPRGLPIRLSVPTPRVLPGQSVFCTGNIPALGFWNPEKALLLDSGDYPDWQVDFSIRRADIPFQYKYFIADKEKTTITWEFGDNRRLMDPDSFFHEEDRMVVVSDYAFRHADGPWKGAGLAIPVFSLRTATGLGVGEFSDLKLLVDWAKEMGMSMIQLLPVNDTSVRMNSRDAYPYATLSVFALHPLYLNLQAIGNHDESMMREITDTAKRLNKNSVVDYEAVMSAKRGFLERIFEQQGRNLLDSEMFRVFLSEHAEWLKPYAAFCCLRDRYGTSDWRSWGEFSHMTPEIIDLFTDPDAPHARQVAFYFFIQYHLHRQLLEASQYARDRGVVLKGDIPIGVDKASVETWLNPKWFNMDSSAGAPPDDFALEGQNWGFPTYNWDAMADDDHSWWKRRLRHLSSYFDAVRLDHVIGFFRLWEIPGDAATALRGRFNPAVPLDRKELASAGIQDIDALCEPYITDDVLKDLFGDGASEMVRSYLEPSIEGRYRFRPEFDSQNRLAAHFSSRCGSGYPLSQADAHLLRKLFRIHDDVALIPDKPGDRMSFHPRIALDLTRTFQSLDKPSQDALRSLCSDYYYERQESAWAQSAVKKLSALKAASDMLLCGEDLGMVPRCTAGVMEELGLLGLRIQRMPAEPWTLFADPASYPYLSVASPSTHDMTPIRGWWEEADRAVLQLFYNSVLNHGGVAPKTCETWLCRQIVVLHLASGSIWTIFPIQDILGISAELRRPDPRDERINEPADAHNRWNFRLHLSLETLLSQRAFNVDIQTMVRASNR
jgi:4-alpha-glucanotransferase